MPSATLFPPVRRRRPLEPDCWEWWSAGEMTAATWCPLESVRAHWPAIYDALAVRSISTRNVCAGVLGTIAIETAHTFDPVEEAFWLDDAWRYANLRYAPFWGRGYVQLTWDYNYRAYGEALGVNLLGDPDLAMRPDIAAAVLAEYVLRANVAEAAERCDWPEVRRRVQGAHAGLDELLAIVGRLGY